MIEAAAVAPDTPRSDSEIVLAALLAERGGRERFDVVSLSVARALAAVLTGSVAPSPGAIETLTAMLPPKASAGAAPYDLQRLNAKEFRLLDHLLAVARGEIKGAPLPRSRSELQAQLLGWHLAKVEKARRTATVDERTEIKSLLDSMLWACSLSADAMWPAEQRGIYKVPARVRDAAEAPLTKRLPAALLRPLQGHPRT